MKPSMLIVLILVSLSCLVLRGADEPQPEKSASYWMRKKLEYSEKILGGLAAADFDTIGKTARTMNALTHMEKWVRGTTPEYRTQLHLFEHANQQLIRSADKENLDGAALAYVQLTLSCVNCHKVVRDLNGAKPPAR
jgi:hypothetical protein